MDICTSTSYLKINTRLPSPPIWYLCVHTHAIWPMQCVEYISTLHDKHLLGLATGLHGGQRAGVGKPMHVIAYASRTMDPIQLNYITTEKELLAIVFALDKFCSYLLGSKIVVFFDHAALRFLLKKPDAKPKLIR
ncbi:Retrovirus-related Pol polyprotein, partial [Mucuna pruriens]